MEHNSYLIVKDASILTGSFFGGESETVASIIGGSDVFEHDIVYVNLMPVIAVFVESPEDMLMLKMKYPGGIGKEELKNEIKLHQSNNRDTKTK